MEREIQNDVKRFHGPYLATEESRRILDIGYANAEDRYLKPLIALRIPELYGLDLVGKAVQGPPKWGRCGGERPFAMVPST